MCLAWSLHSLQSPISSDDQSYQIFLFLPFPCCLYSGLLSHSYSSKTAGTDLFFRRSRLVCSAISFCKMGAGAFLEPLVVVALLFGGTWINRRTDSSLSTKKNQWQNYDPFKESYAAFQSYQTNGRVAHNKNRLPSPSSIPSRESSWRERDIKILGWHRTVASPDTSVFENRLLSRLVYRYPFLVECWYWALIYWVSQSLRPTFWH